MVDIHSHILCGADHGTKEIEETIKLLKISEESGVTDIFLTPHYNVCGFNKTISEIKSEGEILKSNLKEIDVNVNIHFGQEVYLTRKSVVDFIGGRVGTLGDSKYMLVELDYMTISKEVLDLIYELRVRDIIPVIAHPERYKYVVDKPFILNELIKEGCLFQLNYSSLIGSFGRNVKKTAEFLMKSNIYSFIGSDAHNLVDRTTRLDKKRIPNKQWDNFCLNGKRVINNEEIYFQCDMIKKKSLFS